MPPSLSAGASQPQTQQDDGQGPQEADSEQQRVKRAKPRGGVWVPPHRRPDYRWGSRARAGRSRSCVGWLSCWWTVQHCC